MAVDANQMNLSSFLTLIISKSVGSVIEDNLFKARRTCSWFRLRDSDVFELREERGSDSVTRR